MRATVPLRARKGRASYLGDRSVGHQRPRRHIDGPHPSPPSEQVLSNMLVWTRRVLHGVPASSGTAIGLHSGSSGRASNRCPRAQAAARTNSDRLWRRLLVWQKIWRYRLMRQARKDVSTRRTSSRRAGSSLSKTRYSAAKSKMLLVSPLQSPARIHRTLATQLEELPHREHRCPSCRRQRARPTAVRLTGATLVTLSFQPT